MPLLLLAYCSCAESDAVIRQKLGIILEDDLRAILEGVESEGLIDTPYFDLLEYRKYDEGVFIRMAVADFYFLSTINMKITRKYRYHKRMGMWDRYYNKWYSFTPEQDETETKTETETEIDIETEIEAKK